MATLYPANRMRTIQLRIFIFEDSDDIGGTTLLRFIIMVGLWCSVAERCFAQSPGCCRWPTVGFVAMIHFLEHLPDAKTAEMV